jgi:small conductance mechanosensitive channel
MNEKLAMIDQAKQTLLDLAIRFGPRVLTAILIFAIGLVVSRWVGRRLERGIGRVELEPPVRLLLTRMVRVLILALFAMIALQNLGVELFPLIAGLGVVGAGVALATQGVLSNVVAGLSIILTKPFRVGEYIAIAGVEGWVQAITLFNTTLSHVDRSRVVIPNRKIAGEILHNFGTVRQLDIMVAVAYNTDLNAALAAIDEVLKSNPRVLKDPTPLVQTMLLGDWCVNIGVKPWVAVPDYVAATGELNKAILEMCQIRNIVIPFPQQEVHLIGTAVAP